MDLAATPRWKYDPDGNKTGLTNDAINASRPREPSPQPSLISEENAGRGLIFVAIGAFLVLVVGTILNALPYWLTIALLMLVFLLAVGWVLWRTIKNWRWSSRHPVKAVVLAGMAGMCALYFGPKLLVRPGSTELSAFVPPTLARDAVRSERNGVILYQLVAPVNAWSKPVTLSGGAKQVQLRSLPRVRIRVNGAEIEGGGYSPHPNDQLSFMSASNQPARATVRLFMRTPTFAEFHSNIPLLDFTATDASSKSKPVK